MRTSKFIVAVLLLAILVTPGVSAIQKEKEWDFNLSAGSHRVIVVDPDWEGDIVIEFDSDPEVDLYIIEGNNGSYSASSVKVRVFENITDVRTVWSEKGNYSIVIDNLDNPSDTDAPGTETASIVMTVTWTEDLPADPFLTAFCCGLVLIFVIILFYVFVRFFLRKPPKADVEEVEPGTVKKMPGPKTPGKKRSKPPAPAIKPKKPSGPKWPPGKGEGPEQGS